MITIIRKYTLEIYVNAQGKRPFTDWLESLRDKRARYRIKERLERVAFGNFGDYKLLKDGVYELRLAFGPGYRLYFAKAGQKIVLLLCGGNKTTQKRDIERAKSYWEDYLSR